MDVKSSNNYRSNVKLGIPTLGKYWIIFIFLQTLLKYSVLVHAKVNVPFLFKIAKKKNGL
jgi:hypothetical protein